MFFTGVFCVFQLLFRYLSKYKNLLNSIFKALNDQTRREILSHLKKSDLTAGQIADHFHISKPSISHHLDILKRAGLVTSERKGQFISYSINTTIIEDVLQYITKLKK